MHGRRLWAYENAKRGSSEARLAASARWLTGPSHDRVQQSAERPQEHGCRAPEDRNESNILCRHHRDPQRSVRLCRTSLCENGALIEYLQQKCRKRSGVSQRSSAMHGRRLWAYENAKRGSSEARLAASARWLTGPSHDRVQQSAERPQEHGCRAPEDRNESNILCRHHRDPQRSVRLCRTSLCENGALIEYLQQKCRKRSGVSQRSSAMHGRRLWAYENAKRGSEDSPDVRP